MLPPKAEKLYVIALCVGVIEIVGQNQVMFESIELYIGPPTEQLDITRNSYTVFTDKPVIVYVLVAALKPVTADVQFVFPEILY